ncbi:MAG TPA: M50 family metallopeptidase [Candidatus Onthovicinus excrementipullorum]|nr:M50 family metallopeptidase [Candidatus Onthovicinus excrementipullorum]
MRDFIKVMGILWTGILVAVFIYPCLHEAGHMIAALLAGAEVADVQLLPLPSILCNIKNVGAVGQVFIGLAGMIVPALFSLLCRISPFYFWYAIVVLRGICLLSLIISGVAIVLFQLGIPIENEDMTGVLSVWPGGWPVLSFLLLLLGGLLVKKIVAEHPVARCLDYFHIDIAVKKREGA